MDAGPGGDDAGEDPGEDAGRGVDGGPPSPASEQIAAVLVAPAGVADLPIEGALVTYVRPAVGEDPAGFFLQAQGTGPAVFVRVDPASLAPPAEVGQRVELRAIDLSFIDTNQGRREIVGIADWTVESTGNDVTALIQDISSIDVVADLGAYAMELVTTEFEIRDGYRSGGPGFVQISIATAALPSSDALTLRIPDSLVDALNLELNCQYTLAGTPLWTIDTIAQLTVFDVSEVSQGVCDPPSPTIADALNERTIVVRFNRMLDAASVVASGAQFTVSHTKFGAVPVIAAVAGDSYVVLTTSADLLPGRFYTVRVASSVEDTTGSGVPSGRSMVMVEGYTAHLVINEIDYAQVASDGQYIEIQNPSLSPISLAGITLYTIDIVAGAASVDVMIDLVPNSAGVTELPPGGFLVVTTPTSSAVVVPAEVPVVTLATSLPDDQTGLILATASFCHDSIFYEGLPTTPASIIGCTDFGVAGTDSGQDTSTLARIPNASDFEENSLDFRVEAPTVGTANVP